MEAVVENTALARGSWLRLRRPVVIRPQLSAWLTVVALPLPLSSLHRPPFPPPFPPLSRPRFAFFAHYCFVVRRQRPQNDLTRCRNPHPFTAHSRESNMQAITISPDSQTYAVHSAGQA